MLCLTHSLAPSLTLPFPPLKVGQRHTIHARAQRSSVYIPSSLCHARKLSQLRNAAACRPWHACKWHDQCKRTVLCDCDGGCAGQWPENEQGGPRFYEFRGWHGEFFRVEWGKKKLKSKKKKKWAEQERWRRWRTQKPSRRSLNKSTLLSRVWTSQESSSQ